MRYDKVLDVLAAHKGDGTWAAISEQSGVHYDTIARIARRDMPSPGVLTIEKIADALVAMFPEECGDAKAAA